MRSVPITFPRLCLAVSLTSALFVLSHVAAADPAAPERPVQLILDTDIGNDCDDVMAMGVIHSLQSRGECELLAVTITKDNPLAAAFTDALNTFYGRGEIPIGVCDSGVTPEKGRFNVLAEQHDDGRLRYPHDLRSDTEAPSAVDVLRQTLAAAEDHSVVIAQVGFSTNLANLLRSGPDKHSKLSGVDLVKQKVRLLSAMAGAFTKIPNNKGELYDHREYNVVKDLESARYLAEHWPAPIVWSGFEIGLNLRYPHESIEKDFDYVDHHPIAEAYVLYNPPPHDRPTWDLTSVLHAVRPDRTYFDVSPPGRVTVDKDGLTTFEPVEGGRDQYLILRDDQKGRATEALVALTSQPPSK
ncbi:Inosine-uridine preferring nucleoside hydrolase [Stieleria maiorica]|uniref:Inosine-uridine preferring nucleoside hydrolase n=1 Tax=Stieleria maiorica TaxID=2795974 RepID=A0A5B9MIX2_9BACT|nr:nucleoside hydrolase [Stieleria maiorica]QEF99956.1 Inosine-uridine preferring nucleoside hydrolase [Stieleria maiorica]